MHEDADQQPVRQQPTQACTVSRLTGRVVSLAFLSDHRDDDDGKLLKKSPGEFRNVPKKNAGNYVYQKPDWTPERSDPISQTKATPVIVELTLELTTTTPGNYALTVTGTCDRTPFLSFRSGEKDVQIDDSPHRVTLELTAGADLPSGVTHIAGKTIAWKMVGIGIDTPLGTTGPHEILVTFAPPQGTVKSEVEHTFTTEDDEFQEVTHERLVFAVNAVKGSGQNNEKECVDALLAYLSKTAVFYAPGFNWPSNTGMKPKPSLEQYLWCAAAGTAQAECHNLAAAFILICRILGVRGGFAVGYMHPQPRRQDDPPYDEITAGIADATIIPGAGAFSTAVEHQWTRDTDGGQHVLIFIDGNGKQNAFEGVARYEDALYAIGEGRYDLYTSVHDNSSVFYLRYKTAKKTTLITAIEEPKRGKYQLCFSRRVAAGKGFTYAYIAQPYVDVVAAKPPKGTFYWHE